MSKIILLGLIVITIFVANLVFGSTGLNLKVSWSDFRAATKRQKAFTSAYSFTLMAIGGLIAFLP